MRVGNKYTKKAISGSVVTAAIVLKNKNVVKLIYKNVYINHIQNTNENILHNWLASLSSPFLIFVTLQQTAFSFLKDSTRDNIELCSTPGNKIQLKNTS
jgi:hypothetical protein